MTSTTEIISLSMEPRSLRFWLIGTCDTGAFWFVLLLAPPWFSAFLFYWKILIWLPSSPVDCLAVWMKSFKLMTVVVLISVDSCTDVIREFASFKAGDVDCLFTSSNSVDEALTPSLFLKELLG